MERKLKRFLLILTIFTASVSWAADRFMFIDGKSYYEILGAQRTDSNDSIKAKYRKAIMAAHPDRNGGDDVLAKKLNEAWDVLENDEIRTRYDLWLRSQSRHERPAVAEARSRGMILHSIVREVANGLRARGYPTDTKTLAEIGRRVLLDGQRTLPFGRLEREDFKYFLYNYSLVLERPVEFELITMQSLALGAIRLMDEREQSDRGYGADLQEIITHIEIQIRRNPESAWADFLDGIYRFATGSNFRTSSGCEDNLYRYAYRRF